MQQRFKKVGILGGTFNPIHYGHLIIAESVRESQNLDKVLLIPSGQPPHKPDSEVIDPELRYEMVRRSVSSNPFFEASRVEIDTDGYTYTVNTLQTLKKAYGDETALYFIVGADVIPELTLWKEFKTVFGLCEFIAVRRPGIGRNSADADVEKLKSEYAMRISLIDTPLIDISSSEIRERCSAGKSIKYLVTEGVEEFIKDGGLYRKTI
jgi:nicotinate-nucleotide adenylyltransferase